MIILSDEMINDNKETFIEIITEAFSKREGANVERLIKKLNASDFFEAPASTRYHNSIKGGLCDHSLNVYYNMMSIAKQKRLVSHYEEITQPVLDDQGRPLQDEFQNDIMETKKVWVECAYEPESIAIVALLHDISKMNYYKIDYRNKKVYCQSGSKKDSGGNFDWVAEQTYATIPAEERFIYGSHEQAAEFMVRQFVPLTEEESMAILFHHAGLNFDSIKDPATIGNVFERYNLAVLLHAADTISAFIDERTEIC